MAALEQGRFAQARADLLRAVEADPGFAGAWLDLAIATHGDGDSAQAEEFLGILQDRFELPPVMAAGVAALRERIAQAAAFAPGSGWAWRGVAQLGGGYDTNANAGLLSKDLTLSFPGGAITLPVADALRPRADSYVLAAVSTEGRSRWGEGQLELTGSARVRRNADAGEFDTQEIQAGLAYESAQPALARWSAFLPGPWRVAANVQQSRLGGKVLFNSVMFSAVHAWRSARCGPQATLDLDFRGFPQARNLGSVTLWTGVVASCPSQWLAPNGAWNLRARVGHEHARDVSSAGRPGGNTDHAEVNLARQWSWTRGNGTHRAEALVQWAMARDSEGYSPLLQNNARRNVRRWTAGLAYTVPMAREGWSATVTFQGFRQDSNLELFRIRGEAVQLTVQRGW